MRKTQKASRLLLYCIFFIACLLIGALVMANGKKWYDRMRQEREIAEIQEEIQRLKSEEQGQQLLLEKLKSPFFIEREGREKFGAKKAGETVILFPKSDDTAGAKKAGEQKGDAPFFSAWFRYFFHAL